MELPDKNWTLLAKLPTFLSTYLKNNKSNCYAILEIPKLKRVLTQEGARHCRKPLGRRSVGSKISIVIIIYTFVTFTVSNIDFHELPRRILE